MRSNSPVQVLLLFLFAITSGVIGCGESKPEDPIIKAKRSIVQPGGSAKIGPVGGGYQHGAKQDEYEGPASKAPAWAK